MGCRTRAAKATLLRLVVVESSGGPRLAPDPAGRLPGRGAHVHLDPACVDLAERRRAFVRALRLERPPDLTALREHLSSITTTHDESRSTNP